MTLSTSPRSASVPLFASGTYRVDPSRSRAAFAIRKLGAGTVHGHFADVAGELVVEPGRLSASGRVLVAGITTGDPVRDAHLCAPGFFAADEHPEITFVSRELAGTDRRGVRIRGDLTIRDRCREVELTASPADSDGSPRIEVRGEIDRRDFGLTWNRAIEASGVVSATVRIELDLRFVAY